MLRFIGKLLPFILVRWLVKQFGHEFVPLNIGDKDIKGKLWRTGTDEGFFISDLAEMKQYAEKQREKLREYENKIQRLEEQ